MTSNAQPLPALPIVAEHRFLECVVCHKPIQEDDTVVFANPVCSFRCDDFLAEYELGLL